MLKRYLAKFTLFILKGAVKLRGPFVFVLFFLKKPFSPIGRFLYAVFFLIYKVYFNIKRKFSKFVPSKDIRSLATNKYIIHAVIVIVALATVSQNLYAYSGALGNYGKKSILFKLTRPTDGEEVVEGLPINSDIESEMGEFAVDTGIGQFRAEANNMLGFVGADHTPSLETQSTRTSIEYYVVQKGDTLGGISQEFGVSLNTLLWANQLTLSSYIRPGDKLAILPVSGVMHTVKKGDTLARVASSYNAEEEKIIEFNNLADAGSLQIGQVLVVPDGKIIYTAPARTYASGFIGTTQKTYTSSGKLLWPVPSKRITQYYHWRHPGLDIGLPTGSGVFASEDGVVIYSGWGTGYGYQVLIDHENGIKTRYAHNSRLYVRTGDRVVRGQTISLSGNTGWSTGPHLHYEVYVNGSRKNPLLYIR